MPADMTVLSRRDRLRASTTREIVQVARRLLVDEGSAAISLRAIAREMGMTAPGLYRYFGSHEELIRHVIADIFTELADYLEEAVAAAGSGADGRGTDDDGPGSAADRAAAADGPGAAAGRTGAADRAGAAGDPAGAATDATAIRLIAAAQAYRAWAVTHPAEFGLLFGTPLPGIELRHDDPLSECGQRFGGIFLRLYADLWRIKPFRAPADDEIDPSLREQLARYRTLLGTDLPLGVLQTFLRSWVLLYGTVSLEVFGHLKFALDDSAQMFELMLADLAAMIGLSYPAPA